LCGYTALHISGVVEMFGNKIVLIIITLLTSPIYLLLLLQATTISVAVMVLPSYKARVGCCKVI